MKVLLLSRSLSEGGAARAASRWIDSINCDYLIEEPFKLKYRVGQVLKKIENLTFRKWDSGTYGPPSISFFSSINLKKLKNQSSNVYFIHWVQSNFISLYKLFRISPKSIFYAHDEWLLTNIGHYLPLNEKKGKRSGLKLLQSFKKNWILSRCICVVTPSYWLGNKFLQHSPDTPVFVIPNPMHKLFLETSDFVKVREKYGFKLEAKIVLMISDANFHDPRKGLELGLDFFCSAQKILPDLQLLFVGRSPKDAFVKIKNVHNWGYIQNDNILRDAYVLANCTLVPSKIDNFPQTSTESQSTGTPVILFDTGGCAETILLPKLSGQVVPLDEPNKFVDTLIKFVEIGVAQHITNRRKIQSLARMKWSSLEIQKQFHELLQKNL